MILLFEKVVYEHDRVLLGQGMRISQWGGMMVIVHLQELLLAQRGDSELSVLRAADRNIKN